METGLKNHVTYLHSSISCIIICVRVYECVCVCVLQNLYFESKTEMANDLCDTTREREDSVRLPKICEFRLIRGGIKQLIKRTRSYELTRA